MAKPDVIIYTMHDCPFCQKAKDILKEMNVKFEERNVSESIKWRQQLLKETNDDKLPTVVVNGNVLVKPGEDKLRATVNFELHA
jgi:glutaredoxin